MRRRDLTVRVPSLPSLDVPARSGPWATAEGPDCEASRNLERNVAHRNCPLSPAGIGTAPSLQRSTDVRGRPHFPLSRDRASGAVV
jgi:hypothetical protein